VSDIQLRRGRPLEDMTKEELIKALIELDKYYQQRLEGLMDIVGLC